ncbi:MAG TPA: class I lanthipeptide [Thermoanaerobaculia bacterium]|nr:class I lanthipeptide [Thermoanaerobaculia bacterium]
MKKTETLKKLTLSRETVLHLSEPELRHVAGRAGWSDDSICPTTTPSDCKHCG